MHILSVGTIITIIHSSAVVCASSFVPPIRSKPKVATIKSSPGSARDLSLLTPLCLVDPTQSSNDSGTNDNEKEESWEGFNPFKRKESSTPLPSILASSNISVRKIRMQELTNELFLNVSIDDDVDARAQNANVLNLILSKNVDLLLEPLEEEDAVGMDEDSIYDPGMTRDERFGRYEFVMREREAKAVNKGGDFLCRG